MTELSEISDQIKALSEQNKALSKKVEEFAEGDDLELELEKDATNKNHSQMLEINPMAVDSYGDSIELTTKSRLKDNAESFTIAFNFVEREYHNMIGNRYGRHSKLIPVYTDEAQEIKNRINMTWYSGNDIRIVKIKGRDGKIREYYKVRLLVYDILTKKLLLSRIPTGDGKARGEEIQHMGAGRMTEQGIQDLLNIKPMRPISYSGGVGKQFQPKKANEAIFE